MPPLAWDSAAPRSRAPCARRDACSSATRFRETGYSLLMQALAARGNVAEALQVYERARTVFRDELGIPPGPVIHDIHAALLSHQRVNT